MVALAILGNEPAVAQPAKKSIDVQRVEKQLDEQQRRQNRAKPQPQLARPATTPPSHPGNSQTRFKLRGVDLRGANVLSRNEMLDAYEPFLGKMVSEADLARIADALTELYRSRGYFLSRAIIPSQDVAGGRISIQIIEGIIEAVLLSGRRATQFGLDRLTEPLTRERPITLPTFERQLLLINDTPGVGVEDTMLRELGVGSGRFELTIVLDTWWTWSRVALDNRGTQDVGPLQGFASGALNSPISSGETLAVDLSTVPDNPSELAFGRATVTVPFGSSGARVAAMASRSNLKPSGARRRTDTDILTDNFVLKGTLVSFRSRKSSLWLTVLGGIRNAEETTRSGVVYKDKVRAVSLISDYQADDTYGGANYLTVNLRQGLSIFDASQEDDPYLSRYDAGGAFTKLYASYTRYQSLSDNWSVSLSAEGQVSNNPLLSSEEFYLGGAQFGRTFEGGELSGDSGIAGSIELQFDVDASTHLMTGYQIYGFVDGGAVWDRHTDDGSPRSLASFGAGVRFRLSHGVVASAELSKPFVDHSWAEHGDDARVFFTLSKSTKF